MGRWLLSNPCPRSYDESADCYEALMLKTPFQQTNAQTFFQIFIRKNKLLEDRILSIMQFD